MKKTKQPFATNNRLSDRDSLLITLILAALLHFVVIFGLNFKMPDQPEITPKSIDITFINTPSKKAPKEAKFVAEDNQMGAGAAVKKQQQPKLKMPSEGDGKSKQVKKPVLEEKQARSEPKVIVQKQAKQAVETANNKHTDENEVEQHQQISAESLQQQIAQLGTEIGFGEQGADDNKINFVNIASARKYLGAGYLEAWQTKVVRIGNLNYPAVAAKKNFSSALMMDVGIKSDGSIYSINITKSSGNQALDEAAKRIVRMSAPFPPIPADLLKELKLKQQDILMISRVWKFSDESGMVAH